MNIKRRDFLKVDGGVAAGAAVGAVHLGQGRERAVEQHAGEGREAARAALEPLRPGRHRPVHGRTSRSSPRSTASRCASTTKAGRTCGPKAAVAANTGAARTSSCRHNDDANLYPEKLRRRDRRRQLSRQASTAAGIRCASRTCGRTARSGSAFLLGAAGSVHGLPREPREGGRLRQLPEGHRRLPQAVQGAEGEGHAGRLRARQRDRRREHVVPLARLGASAASSSTRTTRSSSTARRRSRRSSTRRSSTRRSSRARCRGSTRTTTRRSSTARSRVTNNGISIYYAAKNSPDPKLKEMATDINHANIPDRPRRACRPSSTCSSTR